MRATGEVRRKTAGASVLLLALAMTACAGTQPRNLAGSGEQGFQQGPEPGLASSGPALAGGSAVPLPGTVGAPTAGGIMSSTGPSAVGNDVVHCPPPWLQPSCANAAPQDGNGGVTDVGITPTSILIGGMYIESGPIGTMGMTMLKAVRALVNEVNAAGGVYGRKIIIDDCDTAYTSGQRAVQCFSKLVDQDRIFMFGAAGDGPALVTASPLMCSRKIPAAGMDGLAGQEYQCAYVFPVAPPASSQAHVVADYYVRTLHPSSVGILYENDGIGQEWMNGAIDVFNKYGVRIATKQSYNVGDTNLTTQVTNMRFAKPDFIFYAAEPLGPILFHTEAKAQGYRPPMPDAGVTCNAGIWPKEIGSNSLNTLCENPWQLPSAKLPGQQTYLRVYEKYYGTDDLAQNMQFYTEIAWAGANFLIQTLREAGPHLTRSRIMEVLNGGGLNGFDTGWGVTLKHSRTSSGGNAYSTTIGVVKITSTNGNSPEYWDYYTLVEKPHPDPYFKG